MKPKIPSIQEYNEARLAQSWQMMIAAMSEEQYNKLIYEMVREEYREEGGWP